MTTPSDSDGPELHPTSNAAFPHPPWQFAWKSPQWHRLPLSTETAKSSSTPPTIATTATTASTEQPPVSHAAARLVLPRDLPSWQPDDPARESSAAAVSTEQDDNDEEDNDKNEYFMTVTLQPNGTDLSLEVWRQGQAGESGTITAANTTTAADHKTPQEATATTATTTDKHAPDVPVTLCAQRWLQWPAAVLPEGDHPSTEAASSSGAHLLAQVGLGRKPPADAWTAYADALDVLHWLSLDQSLSASSGGGGLVRDWIQRLQQQQSTHDDATTTNPPPHAHNDDENQANEEPAAGELILLCLDHRHVLHAYSVAQLWRASASPRRTADPTNNNDDSSGWATFLLGADLLAHVQRRLAPLASPWHVASLGQTVGPWDRVRDGPSASAFGAPPLSARGSGGTTTSVQQPVVVMVTVADLLCVAGSHPTSPGTVGGDSPRGLHSTTAGGAAGVCSFVSLRTLEEVRRVYLPFVPRHVYPWHWNGWVFVLCIGNVGSDTEPSSSSSSTQPSVCAIRVDGGTETEVASGEAPSLFAEPPPVTATLVVPEPTRLHVGQFQILPVVWPDWSGDDDGEETPRHVQLCMILGSATHHCAAVYQEKDDDEEHRTITRVVQYQFGSIDRLPQDRPDLVDVYGAYHPAGVTPEELPVLCLGRETVVATFTTDNNENQPLWGFTRHGWGLLGLGRDVYWIGWQGQRQAVAYCHHVATLAEEEDLPAVEAVQSLEPWKYGVPTSTLSDSTAAVVPTGTTTLSKSRDSSSDEKEVDVDTLILDAMESISALNYRGTITPPASPLRRFRKALTQREKSERLLRQCSSWTRLEMAEPSLAQVNFVQPVVSIRSKHSHHVVTMRQIDLYHAEKTPFDLILSWLAHHKDYFTAASLSLDLLQDGSALRHLWYSYGKVDLDDEDDYAILDGLLDGVKDVFSLETKQKSEVLPNRNLARLADMTIGCLIKGGFRMSSTLEQFVLRDKHYDTSRAALMLVATAACCLSDDKEAAALTMGSSLKLGHGQESDFDASLWPVRSLLNVGVARDMLSTTLLLLNATIPDTLRNRRASDLASAPAPSLPLCRSLVSLIVGTSSDAPELLLSLIDEQARVQYWDSLDRKTQLELSLVRIRGNNAPMLLQLPVRNWVLAQLQDCLATEGSAASMNVFEKTPNHWLQQLVLACLQNAGCSLRHVFPASISPTTGKLAHSFDEYCAAVERGRDVILSSKGTFGVDFDMLIGALLVLEGREIEWKAEANISTQQMLNAACHFAGRRSQREPIAPLNAPVLMRQCFLAGNIQAGANLVGGVNGLVMGCCHVLVSMVGIEIDAAEELLTGNSLSPATQSPSTSEFTVAESHYEILWMLREHTLRIQYYGDFTPSSKRTRIDPVRAARVCLKTWWHATSGSEGSTRWLVQWLQEQLEINENRSPHRLACAALLRALIWPSTDTISSMENHQPSDFLASLLRIPNPFLTQLALSACGLVEAIPPELLDLPLETPLVKAAP